VAGGGELGHVDPNLGDDDVRGVGADAGDLVETRDDRQRSAARIVRVAAGIGGGRGRVGGGDLGDQPVDPERERLGLQGERVDLVEQQLRELGVVVVEPTGECLNERVRGRARRRAARPASRVPRRPGCRR
jgi:hypothetical protein